MMKKYVIIIVCLCFAIINCWVVSNRENSLPIILGLETVEGLANSEWTPEYQYQAFGKCGLEWAYKCVICKTGEYCSHFSCLRDCN